jgi:hypothetical protein
MCCTVLANWRDPRPFEEERRKGRGKREGEEEEEGEVAHRLSSCNLII